MKVKRIVGLWLAVLFAAMQLMCGLAFADGEKTETVIHTWYDDAYNGDHRDKTTGRLIAQISDDYNGEIANENSKETDIKYNGLCSLKIFDSKGWLKYNEWNSLISDITKPSKCNNTVKNIKNEIKAGRAYLCGWFYTDTDGVRLCLDEQKKSNKIIRKLPKGEWVFINEKVCETTQNGAWEIPKTGGSIYIDDLKLVSVSDGSEPTPFKGVRVPSEPDMYTKNLYTLYSNGSLNAFHQHNRPEVTRYINYSDTEKTINGLKTIKMTGELYLQPIKDGKVVKYGELSEEIKTAIEDGRAYLTFWQYINKENLSETDEGYNEGVTWELSFPGNVRTRDEWVWVKTPITNSDAENIYFKCKNAYAWIGDICITVFEDREEGFLEDKYELNEDGKEIGSEQNEIYAGQTLSLNAEYYNNTKKLEKVMPITAIYNAEGKLEMFDKGETVSIIPFKSGNAKYSFKLPNDCAGKRVKFMLWSDLLSLKSLKASKEFVIVD